MAEDEDSTLEEDAGGLSIEPGSSGGGRRRALYALLAEFFRRLLGMLFEDEVSRVRRKVDGFRRRVRLFGALAFTTLAFALFAFVVWTLVGVVWLVENTPAPSDPAYFAVGLAVGYVASLLAGLVYSR